MLVLHGSWLPRQDGFDARFSLWAEVTRSGKRRAAPGRAPAGKRGRDARAQPRRHPFGAKLPQMLDALVPPDVEATSLAAAPDEILVRLPSTASGPLPSPDLPLDDDAATGEATLLQPWRTEALALSAACAAETLLTLADVTDRPDVAIGTDARYWIAVARFALALVYRQRLMPVVRKQGTTYEARWCPLTDEPADRERLDSLVRAMPPVCRALALDAGAEEPQPRALVCDFLERVTDALAREALREERGLLPAWPRSNASRARRRSLSDAWLDALRGEPALTGQPDELAAFYAQYCAWAEPAGAAPRGDEPFRLCLRLDPPATEIEDGVVLPRATARDWTLEYALQATDDPSLLVPAPQVWRERGSTARFLSRRLDQPQERLLGWLGQAARLFPPIEDSLRTATPVAARLTAGEAHEFVRETALLLRANGFGVLVPGLETRLGVRLRLGGGRSAPGQTRGPGMFSQERLVDFDWELALGDQPLSRQEFEALARLKQPLVQVRGRWVEVRPEQLQQALAFFKEHGKDGQMALSEALALALAPDGQAGLPVVGVTTEGWVDEVLRGLRDGARHEALAEPPGFVGELRRYQRVGLSWLAALQRYGLGACLADDMGLGKTIQVIALLLHQRQNATPPPSTNGAASKGRARASARVAASRRTPASRKTEDAGAPTAPDTNGSVTLGPALLVCPTSVVGNWQRELARFAPSLRVLVHHGADRDKAGLAALAAQHDVVLSTYALLHRDEAELAAVTWSAVILDEAQNIKNAATRAAQAARRLPAGWRAALTGTPVENRLADLWSIFQFLNPGYLGSAETFRKRFAAPIERGGDTAAAERLKTLVGPFILRRVKTDRTIIQDLPEKNEMKVYCPLTREQATLYQAVVQTSLGEIEASEGIQRRGQVLAALTKLKQLCNHPALFLHDNSALPGRSGKLARLSEMLEEVLAVDDRALVFTQYAEMGKLLQEYLQSTFRREVLVLHGGTPAATRDRLVARFQAEGRGPQVFILSLKAGGTGLNLTRANHVFHFDRWWNPAVEDQATDRAFRIGQRRDVQVHKFICAGTFEEAIDELITRKMALAQQIVGTSEAWLTELGNDELRALLALRQDAVAED